MVIFKPKPRVNPFGKMLIFRLVEFLIFIAQKGLCFVLEHRKTHFPGLYCLKKLDRKKGQICTKTLDKPLSKNLTFLTFLASCFFSSEKPFFVVEYRKTHFPGLYYLIKKDGKMAVFLPKPFGRMSIFRVFKLLLFIAQKGDFSFQNIVKDIFLTNIA